MKFGLTGDTHNNLKNIETICNIFNGCDIDFVIHTGDITLPKALEKFNQLKMPFTGVFGNNDQGDKKKLLEVCKKYDFDFDAYPKVIKQNNFNIFVVHDPLDIEESFYDEGNIIVHGHTHRFRDELIKGTHIFNPGECAGFLKGKNSIGIVNTDLPSMDVINF